MALTDKRIRGLRPDSTDYVESDNGPGGRRGLYVVVTASGSKIFRARVMVDGRTQYQTFAPDCPDLSLADARDAFDDYKRGRRRGATAHAIASR